MEPSKEFFAHAVQLVEIDGNPNIPTAVLYRPDGKLAIGSAAIADSSDILVANEDFKIDLGRHGRALVSKKKHRTAAGTEKTAIQIADDFIYEVLAQTKQWLAARGISECKNIIVAEPLAMHTDEVAPDWLPNYRQNLRAVLEGKTMLSPTGMEVDFIPEPFAVFQYYRHGIRHPQVAQRIKHNALVIDFGGGTCDVCIIETTKDGDISYGGRNKRPLAAGSIPVGGFQVNRAIAEHLVRKRFKESDSSTKNGLRFYREWREGKVPIEALDIRYRHFIVSFHALVHRVENLKIALCRRVTDWSVGSTQQLTAPTVIPQDMFVADPAMTTTSLSVTELRDVFVQKIYLPLLKPFIQKKLELGHELLEGARINVILLSGGSANIGWLREMLSTDLYHAVDRAPIVRIPDYQEVVAKGLAVECARRFASGTGDFSGITYNPLNLLLEPDESGCEPKPFKPRTEGLPEVVSTPGLLLPTASAMASFIGKPMRWKIRLNRQPRHRLDYYFLQGSMDPDDTANLQNVEEHTVFTPENTPYENSIHVELTVREDGTATPRFIYKSSHENSPEIAKEGRKFVVDMTYAQQGSSEAYIGFDFGTSNSAVSYIDRNWVQMTEARSNDGRWRELGELVDLLPFPLASPLARFIGQFNDRSSTPPEFSFLEAALTLASFVAFCELRVVDHSEARLFKDFRQRSAGPLWQFLRSAMKSLGSRAVISAPFAALCTGKNAELVNSFVDLWKNVKHEKASGGGIDVLNAVKLLANVSHEVFQKYSFGYFESVQKKIGGKYRGRFRVAHGRPPFATFLNYVGNEAFADSDAMLVERETGRGLCLSPLAFWYPCTDHHDLESGHCFFYDKFEGEGVKERCEFKAAGYPCSIPLDIGREDFSEFFAVLRNWRIADPKLSLLEGLELSEYESSGESRTRTANANL